MTPPPTLRAVRAAQRHVIESLEERCAPAVFIVNVTSDAPDQTAIGDGIVDSDLATDGLQVSLRGAMQEANAILGTDTINFNIPPGGYQTILVLSKLPVVTDPLIIHGSTQPGIVPGTPGITLNGAGAGNADGIEVVAGDSTIEGLVIHRFTGSGIYLHEKGHNLIDNDCIGVDHNGESAAPNLDGGVAIEDVADNTMQFTISSANGVFGVAIYGPNAKNNVVQFSTVGLDRPGTHALPNMGPGVLISAGASLNSVDGSFISGNAEDGVRIEGATTKMNSVTRNFIGLDVSGGTAVANGARGVFLDGSSANVIGGEVAGPGGTSESGRNIISGNSRSGVEISGSSAADNIITGNIIGLDKTGVLDRGNMSHGIFVDGAQGTKIGGPLATQRNIISANKLDGVAVTGAGAHDVDIIGNYIGTDINGLRTGTQSHGNLADGILIANAPTVIVGGSNPGQGNVISDNGGNGVLISGKGAAGAQIVANLIGTDKTGKIKIGNVKDGIHITDTSAITIGGSFLEDGNLISGNQMNGVFIGGAASHDVMLTGNKIGTDTDGAKALGNTLNGVLIDGARENSIGDEHAAGNVISGNGGDGVKINGRTAKANGVISNLIGIDLPATAPLANAGNGVHIVGAPSTKIGGTVDDAGNIISGNGASGIFIEGAKAAGTAIGSNLIGLDRTGLLAVANTGDGVLIDGARKTSIGGPDAARNVISGNTGNGVEIKGASAAKSTIINNFIGLGNDGLSKLGNGLNGVLIDGASKTIIGGAAAGAGNVISDNTLNGVLIMGVGKGTIIGGNLIGLDAGGTLARGNGLDGVQLKNDTGIIVGGANAGLRNIISDHVGLLRAGVAIDGGKANQVLGNYIGTDKAGKVAIANDTGVLLFNGATLCDVGGAKAGEGNVISGNGDGVVIDGANTMFNQLAGNTIGLDSAGAKLGNGGGVIIDTGASNNFVGGGGAGQSNVIAGNTRSGVSILGAGTNNNEVLGNFIGTDAADKPAIGNTRDGVQIIGGPMNNIIGGKNAGAKNVISANGRDGVLISNASSGNEVIGNLIGTSVAGGGPLSNQLSGVEINAAAGNFVGGPANGEDNDILGNNLDGVLISGAAAVNNTVDSNLISDNAASGVEIAAGASTNVVVGNFIGLNAAGNAALGNLEGVFINASPNNTIGGAGAGDGNLISGNVFDGVFVSGAAATGNTISGNFIGMDSTGKVSVANGGNGVSISAAPGNSIGTTAFNVISGNNGDGILITGAAAIGNTVVSNFIGTAVNGVAALGNMGAGIVIDRGASKNTIGGPAPADNTIAFNTKEGVTVLNGGTGNRITQNAIFSNGALGIDLGGGAPDGPTPNDPDNADDADLGSNNLQNFPIITALADGKGADVSIFLQSAPNSSYAIELFLNSSMDPSGFGQGEKLVVSTTLLTDALGHGAVNLIGIKAKFGAVLTATATDLAVLDTSEFSAAVEVGKGPPRVVDSELVLSGNNAGSVVLTFLGALDPATAKKLDNYSLTGPGPDGQFGNADDVSVPVASAKFDKLHDTVTLKPKTAPDATQFLRVFASERITDPSGMKLDGEFDGHFPSGNTIAGGDFIMLEGSGTSLTYADSNGDTVSLNLTGGGVMELLRSAGGEGELLRLINTVAGTSVLNGNVVMNGSGDGTTTLNAISGLTGITNNLPPAKFIITG